MMEKIKKAVNADGWVNLLSSLGGGKDRTSNTTHSSGVGSMLGQTDFEEIYRYNGFGKKVVDIPAHEMTRQWVSFENDTDNLSEKALESLSAKKHMQDTIRWGNLYGGAICIMGIDDGGSLEQPVNESGIRKVAWLRPYDRYQVQWTTSDINDDPESEYFGEVEVYTVNAYTTGTSFRVHASRVLRYDGATIPERSRANNLGWGASVLQAIYDELRHHGIISQSVVSIVEDFVQTTLTMENLTNLISSKDGENIVKKRLEIIDLSRSVNNMILLDKDELFSKQSSSVAGISDIMHNFMLYLSGVTGIPVTKLFGQAPAGLNATGESDIRNFYDHIKSQQEEVLLPMLKKLHRYIMLSRDMGFKGKIDDDIVIEFNPLWQMNAQEDAAWKKTIAETDKIYLDTGVVSAAEIAASRFGNGFNPDTTVDFESRESEPEQDDEKQ